MIHVTCVYCPAGKQLSVCAAHGHHRPCLQPSWPSLTFVLLLSMGQELTVFSAKTAPVLAIVGIYVTACMFFILLGLARTVYIHRIWPDIWWFPCQKYRIYTVYIQVYIYIYGSGQPCIFHKLPHFIQLYLTLNVCAWVAFNSKRDYSASK